jgi:thioredoxin-like negative regulator of GroEL
VYPILQEFQNQHKADVRLIAIDFDQQSSEAERWNVTEIPVVIAVARDGRLLFRMDGASAEKLRQLAKELPKTLQRSRTNERQSEKRSRS